MNAASGRPQTATLAAPGRRPFNRRQFLALSAGAALAGVLGRRRLPVRAQGMTSLTVGMAFRNLESVPAWIAQDKRFFEKYGLNVTIINFQGGARAIAALAGGDMPMCLVGGSDVANARSQGFPIKLIAGIVHKIPFDLVVAKHISSPAQLRGGKGAISSFGGSSDFAMRLALSKLGIGPQEVTLLQVGDESSRLAALQSGRIDFTVLTAGLDWVAFDLGYRPMVKLYELDLDFQDAGIAVNTEWARTHGPQIDAVAKSIITADVFLKNRLNAAAAIALTKPHLPLSEDQLRKGLTLYRDRFYLTYPFVTVQGMEFILKEKKITMPVEEFFDNSYIQALQNANFAATAAKSL